MRSEVAGRRLLREVGRNIYGKDDPTRVYYEGRPQRLVKDGDAYVLILKLPFVKKAEVDILRNENELTIQIGNYRRDILLASVLSLLEVEKATLETDELRIRFVKGE